MAEDTCWYKCGLLDLLNIYNSYVTFVSTSHIDILSHCVVEINTTSISVLLGKLVKPCVPCILCHVLIIQAHLYGHYLMNWVI